MFRILTKRLNSLCRGRSSRRSKSKVAINTAIVSSTNEASIHPSGGGEHGKPLKPIRIATFNAALFSMAPAVPMAAKSASFDFGDEDFTKNHIHIRAKSMDHRPKSILKQSPLHPNSMKQSPLHPQDKIDNNNNNNNNLSKQQRFAKSKLRVSINLPDNEISLKKSGQLSFIEFKESGGGGSRGLSSCRGTRTIVEVLREVNADVVALQDVKAEEEREMKPLSDLAAGLGMTYVFAESWAPEYGNAILSKWPIKNCKVQRIFDDSDFRNVMKATIDVPQVGEFDIYCTLLDHLDENWRMKQMNAIIQSSDMPHILAGGLNSLDESDYSPQRWTEIVKYHEEMGKPAPKVEVMKYLKSNHYCDAKDFGGEYESVVMIAKGQSVQGTCKYGTRVDYILSSPDSVYKFVPGSYSVFSSKGTSDHHIVKVDVVKTENGSQQCVDRKEKHQRQQVKKRLVKITNSNSPGDTWKTQR